MERKNLDSRFQWMLIDSIEFFPLEVRIAFEYDILIKLYTYMNIYVVLYVHMYI